MNEAKSPRDSFITAFGIYGGAGFQLAAAVLGGLYLGYLADQALGTQPWLLIIGLMLGFAGGLYNLVRILNWKNQKGK